MRTGTVGSVESTTSSPCKAAEPSPCGVTVTRVGTMGSVESTKSSPKVHRYRRRTSTGDSSGPGSPRSPAQFIHYIGLTLSKMSEAAMLPTTRGMSRVQRFGTRGSTDEFSMISRQGSHVSGQLEKRQAVLENRRHVSNLRFLLRQPYLAAMPLDQMPLLVCACTEEHFEQGQEVLKKGEYGDAFFIILSGQARQAGTDKDKTPTILTSGMYFGEDALCREPCRVRVTALTSLSALEVSRGALQQQGLLQQLVDIVNAPRRQHGRAQTLPSLPPLPTRRIAKEELHRVRTLGRGGFGTVELMVHGSTGEAFALKSLSKASVVRTHATAAVFDERDALRLTKSPFIVKLHATYSDENRIYFLMEPALGGTLHDIYKSEGFYGSTEHAKYYLAGALLALEHLHQRRLVYRDLKPDNLLLDQHGCPKLADMGFAKFVVGVTFTRCGTPDFMAPELVQKQPHSQAVDWWSFGVMAFYLMSGSLPFRGKDLEEIFSRVVSGIQNVLFPARCQGPVGELIAALLCHEPDDRLPMSEGVEGIKIHRWYAGFGWQLMTRWQLPPPYVPAALDSDLADLVQDAAAAPAPASTVEPEEIHASNTCASSVTAWDKGFEL